MAQYSRAFIVALLLVASMAITAAGQVGQPPVIVSPTDGAIFDIDVGQSLGIEIMATDVDGNLDNQGIVAHLGTHMSPVPTSIWDPSTCVVGCSSLRQYFEWVPDPGMEGLHPVKFKAFDRGGNQVFIDVMIRVATADLEIAATATPEPVRAGDRLTYSLTVANRGPFAARAVSVEHEIIGPHSIVSLTPPASVSCSDTSPVVRCEARTLASETTAMILVEVVAFSPGSLLSRTSVDGPGPDPDRSNNVASLSVAVDPAPSTTATLLWAWGDNQAGALGDGTDTGRSGPGFCCVVAPQPVSSFGPVIATAAGMTHSLAVAGDGRVWAWGSNHDGELGDGTIQGDPACAGGSCRPLPGLIPRLDEVVTVAAGTAFSVALRLDGSIWTWGRNDRHQLGIGRSLLGSGQCGGPFSPGDCSPVPVPVMFPSIARAMAAVAAGLDHAVALTADGMVWTWGNGERGALGVGPAVTVASTPIQAPLKEVKAIAAAPGLSAAVLSDGTVQVWGDHTYGQLGAGVSPAALGCSRSTSAACMSAHPIQIGGPGEIVAVAAGTDHLLALAVDGSVWAWGANDVGQLGNGSTAGPVPCPGAAMPCHTVPVQVSGIADAVAIAAGPRYSLALLRDGTIWAWGLGPGVLGDGAPSPTVRPFPTQVVNIGHAGALSANRIHVLATGSATGARVGTRADPVGFVPAEVRATFGQLVVPGRTGVWDASPGPQPPAGFTASTPAVVLDLSTTATFLGPVTVCADLAGLKFTGPPRMFHYEETTAGSGVFAWIDRTVSVNDTTICGDAPVLGLFALFSR